MLLHYFSRLKHSTNTVEQIKKYVEPAPSQIINFSRPKKMDTMFNTKADVSIFNNKCTKLHQLLKAHISHVISTSFIILENMTEIVHKTAITESHDPVDSKETKKASENDKNFPIEPVGSL